MQRKSKARDKLNPVQIRHWVRAAHSGQTPTVKDTETGEVIQLRFPLAVSDGDGLTFTLSRTATATWILRYRHGGRQKELTIGNYPDIALAEARQLAREKRAEIDRGGDPAAEKRKATAAAFQDWNVRELIQDYREKVLTALGNSTQRSYSRALIRIETQLGSLPVSKITPQDIVALLESQKIAWSESRMLLCTAKMLFKHAAGRKLLAINPCIGIELASLVGKRPPIRRRLMLSEDELKQLLHANMRKENLLAIKLLLVNAVRSEELFNARWEHFDLDNNVWSIPSSKTGPGIQIPLTKQVREWLLELRALSGDSAFILPARSESRRTRFVDDDGPISKDTIRSAIDYWLETAEPKPNIRRFTPHDLRSTAKSHMRALGIPRDITEMCLNHKLQGIEGIYDVHTYFQERKDALTRWNDYLSSLEKA